jgi:uroporphyrinogen decarboxylase
MKRPEPDFTRFLQVVRRAGEPDRVPFAELFHDSEIMTALQGPPDSDDLDSRAAWRVRFWRDLGYDYVSVNTDVSFPTEGLYAEDTAPLSHGQRGWVNESTGVLATWEQFERYPWPTVTDASFRNLEAVGRHLPEGMKVVPTIPGGPMENLTFLMGFEAFSYALVEQPDLIAAIAQRIDEVLCQVVEVTTSLDFVGAQWLNDDMGFKGGTLASPETLRKYVFPTQKRICEIAHRRGKPVLLHSCGKLDDIMDELIDDVGIDAKHSFEDVIMPVWEAKQKWGHRLALLGGVDMDVLARGSEERVRAYTRRCMEECAPGGGWALGSGNTVANYIPVQNFLAMLEEGRR